uniref:7TM_GPCR_Srx domain-containing protein n=1 Tax=Panagrellus redivivus TaxID=6233 RepID=A0A7E4VMU6_PANRE
MSIDRLSIFGSVALYWLTSTSRHIALARCFHTFQKFVAFLSIIVLFSATSAFVPELKWVCGAAAVWHFNERVLVCDDQLVGVNFFIIWQ